MLGRCDLSVTSGSSEEGAARAAPDACRRRLGDIARLVNFVSPAHLMAFPSGSGDVLSRR